MGAKNGKFRQEYRNGDVYDGHFVNGQRDGYGVYISAAGHRYEGMWKDDMRHGKGSLSFVSKHGGDASGTGWSGTYDGEWMNNKKHGHGVFKYLNGDKYEGKWVDGMKEGYGIYTYHNGDRYEGLFQQNDMHGHGKFTSSNGDVVVGHWRKDVQHGPCLFIGSDGTKREERWENGERVLVTEVKDQFSEEQLSKVGGSRDIDDLLEHASESKANDRQRKQPDSDSVFTIEDSDNVDTRQDTSSESAVGELQDVATD